MLGKDRAELGVQFVREGGAVLVKPDVVAETFEEGTNSGGTQGDLLMTPVCEDELLVKVFAVRLRNPRSRQQSSNQRVGCIKPECPQQNKKRF